MSNGNRIGPEYGPEYRHDGAAGQQPGRQTGFEGLNGMDVHEPAGDTQQQPLPQPEEYLPQPAHPQPMEGWGVGEYDADATAFVQLPTGGVPGADPFGPDFGGYGDPLAAPGTGQGMYTPPAIDPSTGAAGVERTDASAGGPLTPSPTTDPAATGQWSLPFAPETAGADAYQGGMLPEHQQPYPEQHTYGDAGSAAAMGQGAAAALAGSHEARTRRPLGTGGGRLPEEEFADDASGTGAQELYDRPEPDHLSYEPAPEQYGYGYAQNFTPEYAAPGDAQFAEAHARRQVPFDGHAEHAPDTSPEPLPYASEQYGEGLGSGYTGHEAYAGPEGLGDAPGEAPGDGGDAGGDPYGGPVGGSVRSGIPWAPSTPAAAGPRPEPQYPQGVHDPGHLPTEPGDPVQGAGWSEPLPAPEEQTPQPEPSAAEPWSGQAEPEPPREDVEFPPRTAAPEPDGLVDQTVPAGPLPSELPEENGTSAPQAVELPEAAELPDAVEAPAAAPPEADAGPDDSEHTADVPAADAVEPAPEESPDVPGVPEAVQAAEVPDAARADGEAAPVVDNEHPHTSYALHVNGVDRPVTDAWIGESLLYVLRERLGLAGAKDGCSQGECGACSVQVDGRLVASCLVPSATAAGSDIRTVEGLAVDGTPSDVQRALTESGAVQCGFCVPGMAMAVHDLLEGNHKPSELQTRQAICGNLCRCSGYRGVLDAVRTVVHERESRSGRDVPAEQPQGAQEHGAAAPAENPSDPGSFDPASFAADRPDGARIPHQAGPGAGGAHAPEDGGA